MASANPARLRAERLAIAIVVVGLSGYAAAGVAYPLVKLIQGLPSGATPSEQAELQQWRCVEDVLSVIPSGSAVALEADITAGTLWAQRIVELGFPRLDFSGRRPAAYRLSLEPIPGDTTARSVVCGDRRLEVARHAP